MIDESDRAEEQFLPRIEIDDKALRFVQDRGSSLYIWSSKAGIEHETTKPHHGVQFDEIPARGFRLFVDESIEAPSVWRVCYEPLPWPHVRALWNGAAFSPSGPHTGAWEGGNPFLKGGT
jgi:hypothetical protein